MKFDRLIFIVATAKQPDGPSAVIHNKHNRRNKIKLTKIENEETIVKWRLSNFVKEKDPNRTDNEFFTWGSFDCLDNGLTSDQVVEFINSELIFNDYEPTKNDLLKIWMEFKNLRMYRTYNPPVGCFMLFTFNEIWIANKPFDHIHNIYQEKFEGELLIE